MSQGDLILACHTKADFMDRDADAFLTRGVAPSRVLTFRKQADAAAKLPSDEQLDNAKQALTDAAIKQRGVVESGMATLMSQVAIVHDSRSPAYKAFGSAGLYDDSEGDFYVNMGHLLDWATAHVTEYAAQGITLVQLTTLAGENEKYLAALKAQRLATSGRSATTQTRQGTLNALYDELSALCGIGQGLFKQTDVSKYNDYVIDPTEHSGRPGSGAHGIALFSYRKAAPEPGGSGAFLWGGWSPAPLFISIADYSAARTVNDKPASGQRCPAHHSPQLF